MNDLLRSFDDEHHLWRLAGGTKAWRFRSRGGDNLAVVNSSCVVGQVLPSVCVLVI